MLTQVMDRDHIQRMAEIPLIAAMSSLVLVFQRPNDPINDRMSSEGGEPTTVWQKTGSRQANHKDIAVRS